MAEHPDNAGDYLARFWRTVRRTQSRPKHYLRVHFIPILQGRLAVGIEGNPA